MGEAPCTFATTSSPSSSPSWPSLTPLTTLQDGPFGEMNRITLPDISTPILEMVCEYLCERRIRGAYLSSFAPLEKLDPTKEEDRLLVIEVLLAANYMDC